MSEENVRITAEIMKVFLEHNNLSKWSHSQKKQERSLPNQWPCISYSQQLLSDLFISPKRHRVLFLLTVFPLTELMYFGKFKINEMQYMKIH